MESGNEKRVIIEFSPKSILWVVMTVFAIWLAYVLREIFVIVFLSYIFSAAAEPLIDSLDKKKIPRSVSIIGLYLLVAGILLLFFRLIIPPAISQITDFAQNSNVYLERLNEYFRGISPDLANAVQSSLLNIVRTVAEKGVVTQALGIFSGLLGLVVVFVISFYLLWQKNGLDKFIKNYLPKRFQDRSMLVSKKISSKMSAWVQSQLFLCVIVFVLDFIGLAILRVPFALVLAIMAGVLELLPIIGPIIAGAVAALIALTVSPLLALFTVIWFVAIQQTESHVLVPQIMKKSLGLNPITVILAILIGGKILGVIGIIIAVPVAVSISIITKELWKGREGKWI
jgi:predicted PurR-regulated permease PerM